MLLFQSNKKKKRERLWRARVKQPTINTMNAITITNTVINNRQQQQLHRQHQIHHLQQQIQQQQQQQQSHLQTNNYHSECLIKCSNVCCSNHQELEQHYNNNNNNYHYHQMNTNILCGERSDSSMIDCQENYTSGYCCESIGSITDCEEDQTMSSTIKIMNPLSMNCQQQHQEQQQQQQQQRRTNDTSAVTMSSIMASTAANVFRNCCGGGYSTDSTLTINGTTNNNNNNNWNTNYTNVEKIVTPTQTTTTTPATVQTLTPNMNDEDPDYILFRALIKKLKDPQLTTLLQTIESLTEMSGNATAGIGYITLPTTSSTISGHQPDCVLVPRGIMNEEPNVFACRLWRWPDLRNANELKNIPSCPNEQDRVYVCCNPSHWSRLCLQDTPPPPYQSIAMERLKPEDRAPSEKMKDGGNSSSNDSTNKKHGARGVQFPGSLTTDGEDSSLISSSWCELAYWELAQRVGGRFPVEKTSINIFWDQYRGDGMCLKTLSEQRSKLAPDTVVKARQKIGLGVTLSQEADGVWLYNRSSAPVFVHSPTLNNIDNWFNVSKVPPGYCLKAFDNYKAKKTLVSPPQIAGAQTGPVDTMSMRISFAKGWGPTYTRQDVTACPCWLEVLLTRNR